MTPIAASAAHSSSAALAVAPSRWSAVLAALLGGLILFGVGFAHLPFAHNAAHDARHAQGFPCH